MPPRFALECREALRWANRLTHDLGQDLVDTPHLLEGLLRVEEGHAANIVKHLLGEIESVRSDVWAMFPGPPQDSGPRAEVPKHPQTENLKKTFEEAIRLAEGSRAKLVTTGHILAALAGLTKDPSAEILRRRGVTIEVVLDHGWVSRNA